MSGGVAYLLKSTFDDANLNKDGLLVESLNAEDRAIVTSLLEQQIAYTDSPLAKEVLAQMAHAEPVVKIIPAEYKKMKELIAKFKEAGADADEAKLKAFKASKSKLKVAENVETTYETV